MKKISGPKLVITALTLCLSAFVAAAENAAVKVVDEAAAAAKPTVFKALILHGTYRGNAHSAEFDSSVRQAKWEKGKYAATTENLDKLTKIDADGDDTLKNYDIVLGCPLMNFARDNYSGHNEDSISIDMDPYVGAFRKFVEDGGALVLIDALYPKSYAWVSKLDQGLEFGVDKNCGSSLDPKPSDPPNAFNFLPNTIGYGNTWGHLTLPEHSSWEVLLRCGCGSPNVLLKRIGKGFVYVSALRPPTKELLENIRTNLEIQRMGLVVTQFERPKIRIGKGVVDAKLKNITDGPLSVICKLSFTPEGADTTRSFLFEIDMPAGEEADVSLPYINSARGKTNVKFTIAAGGNSTVIYDRDTVFPDLLTILPPPYRSLEVESELATRKSIAVGYEIAALEGDLTGFSVKTSIADANGKPVGEPDERKVSACRERFSVKVGALSAGEYNIHSELFANGELLEERNAAFRVLKDSECRAYVNNDMNFVVGGEEFFPIGLYHINGEDLSAFGADLGINIIQLSNRDKSALKIAQENNIKVIWEQRERTPKWVRNWLLKSGPVDDPSIVMWYAADEPNEKDLDRAKDLTAAFHEKDVSRPTFMVAYFTHLFKECAATADVIAPDPYPYNAPDAPITSIAREVDLAWAATRGDKPVVCVLQSFGKEPEGPFRAMAYLAVTHEARGVMWYPWDNGGETGLKYNPELQKVFSDVTSQLKTLTPALLNKDGRRQFKSENGNIHGLFCQEKGYGEDSGVFGWLTGLFSGKPAARYMLLVNPYKDENTIDLSTVKDLGEAAELKEVFGKNTEKAEGTLTLKPYETRVYEVR